ncbi:MAG: hypothetical protein AAF963_01170 [Bacteroidota bacterium]
MNKSIVPKFSTLCLGTLLLFSCSSCDYFDNLGGNETGIQKKITPSKHSAKPIFVLYHGLGAMPSDLESIEEYLKAAYPKASVIARQRTDTQRKSIEDQSKKHTKDILSTLQEKDVKKKRPTILVGHSQGGLIALCDGPKLIKAGYKVAGIVTIGSPLEGAPVLNRLLHYKRTLKHSGAPQALINWLDGLSGKGSGVEDMRPESSFLKNLQKRLEQNSISILAIGGDASGLYKSIDNIVPLSELLGQTLGDKKNDLLLPLNSQLAKNIKTKHLKRSIVEATHGHIKGLPEETSLVSSQKTKNAMIHFIRNELKKSHTVN